MWKELKRIVKDSGAICLFGSEPFSSELRVSNIEMFKYDWIWIKGKETCGGFIQAKNKPIQINEIISMFSKGKTFHKGKTKNRMEYNPQNLIKIDKFKKKTTHRLKNLRVVKNAKPQSDYVQEFTNYPSNILKFKGLLKNRLHPNQKPVELLEYLIKTYTLESETVLDFTMGSGSTGVACLNLNRKFIGIEKEKKYFDIAQNRLNQVLLKIKEKQ